MMLHVGFGHYVVPNQIVAMLQADSKPVRRLIDQARKQGRALDATRGRATRSVIRLQNGDIVLAAVTTEALVARLRGAVDAGV